MKTLSVLLLSITATGFAALALNVALGMSLLFTTGLAAIAVADYTRASRVLKLPATMTIGGRTERFGLAA